MMKNLTTNKLLLLWGVLTLTLAVSWVLAQSNTPITIGTNRFTAIQHIKEVHLNQKKEGKVSKVWLMNTWGTTLGIASVVLGQWGKVDKMEKLNNTTDENSSIIAGIGNKNTAGEGSFLVGEKIIQHLLADNKKIPIMPLSSEEVKITIRLQTA